MHIKGSRIFLSFCGLRKIRSISNNYSAGGGLELTHSRTVLTLLPPIEWSDP